LKKGKINYLPMACAKKGFRKHAVERLEEKGYSMSVRAETKAEVMKCLVDMEEAGEILRNLRIKRYSALMMRI
jgi:hypothetical protein